jgi:hypothetical protein
MYQKRLLGLTAMRDQFLQFLLGEVREGTSAMFRGKSGIAEEGEIELQDDGTDKFEVVITGASRVIVGGGQIIDLSRITGVGITEEIPFENTASTVYHVGVKYAEIPFGLETNERTGDPEYPAYKQTYGELDNPTSVSDQTTYIRININSITESGVDHSGRTIKVWLVDPVSPDESVAYWEGTSAYSNPDNYVDIPYSGAAGPLGQDTSSNPPSTTATDYEVFEEGVTWSTVDLSADSDYAYIGKGTGGTPPTWDISSQETALTNTLDEAYDGAAGSGAGRVINADSGAVDIRSGGGAGDEHNASLRVNRKGDTEDGGICLEVIPEHTEGAGLAHLEPLVHATGNLVLDNAMELTNPDVITRTGSVNFVTSKVVGGVSDLAWVQGTPNDDGLYPITTVTSTTLQVINMDGTTPSFTNSDTGTVTVLRAMFITPCLNGIGNAAMDGLMVQATFAGTNYDSDPPGGSALKIMPHTSDAIHFYNNDATPQRLGKITRECTALFPGLRLETDPLDASGDEDQLILDLRAPQDEGKLLPSARCGRFVNNRDQEILRWEPHGRIADCHRFKDDFHYHSSNWGHTAPGPYYDVGGDGTPLLAAGNLALTGGWAELKTKVATPTSGDKASLVGMPNWQIVKSGPTREAAIYMYARIYSNSISNTPTIKMGLRTNGGLDAIWWEVVSGSSNWNLKVDDGSTPDNEYSNVASVAQKITELYITIDPFFNSNAGFIGGMVAQESVSSDLLDGFSFPSVTGRLVGFLMPFLEVTTGAAGQSEVYIDYWEIWEDVGLLSADAYM